MLVLHVVVAGEIGGAERMLCDLAAAGTMEGIRHAVALFSASPRLTELFSAQGLTVFSRGPVREGPLVYLARSLGSTDVRWLARLMEESAPRIVHLHTLGSHVLGTRAARLREVPIVRTEHSTRVYDDATAWPFSRWSLARADRVVAISDHVEEVVRTRAPWAGPKLRLVHNGVDTARFATLPLPPRPPFRLGLVGRLEPRKGVDVALHALALVPGAELRILGDGEARAKLERLAWSLGVADRVEFVGYVDDTRRGLAGCHAVLSASNREGLGIALLEGMSLGRPAVALPAGGIPEFVGPKTGYLAYGTNAEALSFAIRAAMADPDIDVRGHAARAVVEDRFSLEAMRAGYRAVYMELA